MTQQMSAQDYINNVLSAIDIVSNVDINSMQFNKTITCTIIEQDEEDKTKYYVSDGSLCFEAYVYPDNPVAYSAGTQVYVLIQNNDMNRQKFIVSRYADDKIPEDLYASPFENFLIAQTINLQPSENIEQQAESTDTWFEKNGTYFYKLDNPYKKEYEYYTSI